MRSIYGLVFLFLLGACAPKATVAVIQEVKTDTVRVDSTPVVVAPPAENLDQQSASDDLSFTYLKAKSKVVWKTKNKFAYGLVKIKLH